MVILNLLAVRARHGKKTNNYLFISDSVTALKSQCQLYRVSVVILLATTNTITFWYWNWSFLSFRYYWSAITSVPGQKTTNLKVKYRVDGNQKLPYQNVFNRFKMKIAIWKSKATGGFTHKNKDDENRR